MKNKIYLATVIALSTITLCSCGLKIPNASSNNNNPVVDEDSSDDEASEETVQENASPDYSFEETLAYDMDYIDYAESKDYTYLHRYDLYITGDDTAMLIESFDYSSVNKVEYTYIGSYNLNDNVLRFVYHSENPYEQGEDSIYKFSLDGNKVVSVDYEYGSVESDITGTFYCTDLDYGKMVLDINLDTTATLTMQNGAVYEGNVIIIDDRYDLMASNEFEALDWFIDIDGDSFTYVPYLIDLYGEYSGTYECFGMLGNITIEVDPYGNAYTQIVTEDGQIHDLTGYIYVDEYENSISGVYLADEAGYSIDISLFYLESESMWNYSGSFTTPLSAG